MMHCCFLDSVKNELDILIVKKLVRYDEIFSSNNLLYDTIELS